MEANSYLHLHQEHRNWLSKIDFWKGEIVFLKGICNKFPHNHPQMSHYSHKLDHLNRWLQNMKHQIDSHESFLKEVWGDFPESLETANMEDHRHNRDHMRHFQEAIKEVKTEIYQHLNQHSPQA